MGPGEERLDNELHSWLFQSDWEDTAGKPVVRTGKAGNHPWRWRLRGRSWAGENLGWKLEDRGSVSDCAGNQVRDGSDMTAEEEMQDEGQREGDEEAGTHTSVRSETEEMEL